jgi:hypothetical protein
MKQILKLYAHYEKKTRFSGLVFKLISLNLQTYQYYRCINR